MPDRDPKLVDMRYRLVEALVTLAADAGEQVAYLESEGDDVDELAETFAWAAALVPALVEAQLVPGEVVEHMTAINGIMDGISGRANASLWEYDALLHAREWAQVRSHADAALNGFRRLGVRVPAITDPLFGPLEEESDQGSSSADG